MRRTVLGAAALVLALSGCSVDDSTPVSAPAIPVASAPAGATSGLGGAPAPAGALDGRRQLFLLPRLDDNELPDSVLAVTGTGRIQVTDDYTEQALFVPVPSGGGGRERLIKTGVLRAGGKPFCLQVRGAAGAPLTVVTAVCDAGTPAQLFTFEAAGQDDEGRATYAVRNREAFLQWYPLGGVGLVAEEVGGFPLKTTFSLQDQGPAALPGGD